MVRKRSLSDEEKQLWQQVKRSVKPLRKGAPKEEEPAPEVTASLTKKIIIPVPILPKTKAPLAPLTRGAYAGVDGNTAERFRKGHYTIDATLDLHGLSREKAHHALKAFVATQYQRKNRCLLVITGKGVGKDTTGILRQMLPQWLAQDDIRPMVLAFDVAQQRHGGTGAYYILVRRAR